MTRVRARRSAAAYRPRDPWAAWRAWRALSEAATKAAGETGGFPAELIATLKPCREAAFPVGGASALAAAECLRRAARIWIDAPPARRALLVALLKGAADSVWALIEDGAAGAGRPPHWLED